MKKKTRSLTVAMNHSRAGTLSAQWVAEVKGKDSEKLSAAEVARWRPRRRC